MRIVVPGGSGFLGQLFTEAALERGHEVVILSRRPHPSRKHVTWAVWNGKTLGPWQQHLDGADAVVNFAGRSVNCRYTPENRRDILDSRLDSVRVIGDAIRQSASPPPVLVQAASLAIYGDTRQTCTEKAPTGEGFGAEVCVRWEAAVEALDLPQTRTVTLRIGFVLGPDGGALEPLARLTRFGLGGTVGSGDQIVSWLHADDLNRMIFWAIGNDDAEGTYNATGPTPVTNRTFMRTLREVLGRPWSPPAPAWAVHVGAYFMGTEPSLALTGRRGVPEKAERDGFAFRHTDLRDALRDVLPA